MRKLLLMSAATLGAMLGLATGPVLAQTAPATPPAAPDAGVPAMSGMTGMRAIRGQQREAVRPHSFTTASTKRSKSSHAHRAPAD